MHASAAAPISQRSMATNGALRLLPAPANDGKTDGDQPVRCHPPADTVIDDERAL